MSTPPSNRRKFYVVWHGLSPGIYDSWEECEAQIKGVPGARYKSFLRSKKPPRHTAATPQNTWAFTALLRATGLR